MNRNSLPDFSNRRSVAPGAPPTLPAPVAAPSVKTLTFPSPYDDRQITISLQPQASNPTTDRFSKTESSSSLQFVSPYAPPYSSAPGKRNEEDELRTTSSSSGLSADSRLTTVGDQLNADSEQSFGPPSRATIKERLRSQLKPENTPIIEKAQKQLKKADGAGNWFTRLFSSDAREIHDLHQQVLVRALLEHPESGVSGEDEHAQKGELKNLLGQLSNKNLAVYIRELNRKAGLQESPPPELHQALEEGVSRRGIKRFFRVFAPDYDEMMRATTSKLPKSSEAISRTEMSERQGHQSGFRFTDLKPANASTPAAKRRSSPIYPTMGRPAPKNRGIPKAQTLEPETDEWQRSSRLTSGSLSVTRSTSDISQADRSRRIPAEEIRQRFLTMTLENQQKDITDRTDAFRERVFQLLLPSKDVSAQQIRDLKGEAAALRQDVQSYRQNGGNEATAKGNEYFISVAERNIARMNSKE